MEMKMLKKEMFGIEKLILKRRNEGMVCVLKEGLGLILF